MNIRISPLKERILYWKMRKYGPLSFDRLDIGETTLHLLTPDDPEQARTWELEGGVQEDFPFWVFPWESATLLAFYMQKSLATGPGEKGKIRGQRLLDIGVGPAAPGFIGAKSGYGVTVMRPKPHILDFQKASGAASGIRGVSYRLGDWGNTYRGRQYELIVGAELLFDEHRAGAALDFFDAALAPGGEVLIAHDIRRRGLASFLAMAETRFRVEVKEQEMTREGSTTTIVMNRLRHLR